MNIQIFFISIFYGFISTAYFGWNLIPSSDAEIICNGITMLLLALAFLRQEKKKGSRNEW